MITGDKTKKVIWYLPVDHLGDGYGRMKPCDDNEEFIGHPYGFHTENSYPFIERIRNGKVIETINAIDLAEIGFVGE